MSGSQANLAAADALVLAAMRAQYDNQAAFHAGAQRAVEAAQQAAAISAAAGLGSSSAASLAAGLLGQTLAATPASLGGHAAGEPFRLRPGGDLDKGEPSSIKKSAAVTAAALMAKPEGVQPQPKPDEEVKKERIQKLREDKARKEAAEKAETERRRCHLHSKPKKGCKFCQKYLEFTDSVKEEKAAEREKFLSKIKQKDGRADEDILDPLRDKSLGNQPLELVNTKTYGFTALLQSHIIESSHFKTLMGMESFEQIVEELNDFADTVEPYTSHSATSPSTILCCVYRLYAIGLEGRQLRRLMESTYSPFIRCAGFLYVRFGLAPEYFWPWLGEYILDEEEFQPTKDGEIKTTIGEYVEALLFQEKYYTTILPRVPATIKKKLEEKLAQVPQYRKRSQANQELLHLFRERGARIEACPRDDGEWLAGEIVSLDENTPGRYKVRCRFDSGDDRSIHLGKVILSDGSSSTGSRQYDWARSGGIDLSRDKGRSISELVMDFRSRDRERAVVTSGKEYARRPVSFLVAMPMEQGNASSSLAREETHVERDRKEDRHDRRRNRSRSHERRKEPSAEHQERMRQLFLKYGSSSRQEQTGHSDIDRPDVMRLG